MAFFAMIIKLIYLTAVISFMNINVKKLTSLPLALWLTKRHVE